MHGFRYSMAQREWKRIRISWSLPVHPNNATTENFNSGPLYSSSSGSVGIASVKGGQGRAAPMHLSRTRYMVKRLALVAIVSFGAAQGCGPTGKPSPYDSASRSVATVKLPAIRCSTSNFAFEVTPPVHSVPPNETVDIALTFTSTRSEDIPPFVVVYWFPLGGKRMAVQQNSASVSRSDSRGVATVSTKSPSKLGQYELEFLCQLESTKRQARCPIVVSPGNQK
jgi:hypothetical protein